MPPTDSTMPTLATTGSMASQFGVPFHRILYIVKAHQISPCAKAGHVGVYDEAAVKKVGEILKTAKSKTRSKGCQR